MLYIAGLVLYLTMDDMADANLPSGVSLVDGIVNQALHSDGSGGGILSQGQVPAQSCLVTTGGCEQGVTFAVWVKYEENGSRQEEFCVVTRWANFVKIYKKHNRFLVVFGAVKKAEVNLNNVCKLSEWCHVAIMWDPFIGRVSFYNNGEIFESQRPVKNQGNPLPINQMYIGTGTNGNAKRGRCFIDELYVWTKAQNATFVSSLFQQYGRGNDA